MSLSRMCFDIYHQDIQGIVDASPDVLLVVLRVTRGLVSKRNWMKSNLRQCNYLYMYIKHWRSGIFNNTIFVVFTL